MAILNPPLLDVEPPSSSGLKLGYLGLRVTGGAIDKGLKRGFGGPTATNGGDVSDKLLHDAVTETYDDAWTVQNIAVSTTAIDLTATVVTNMKKIELFVMPTDDAIYVGPANTVTSSGPTRGRYIPPGASYLMPLGPNMKVWAICASGDTATVQVVQFA